MAKTCFGTKLNIKKVSPKAARIVKQRIADAKARYDAGDPARAVELLNEAVAKMKYDATSKLAQKKLLLNSLYRNEITNANFELAFNGRKAEGALLPSLKGRETSRGLEALAEIAPDFTGVMPGLSLYTGVDNLKKEFMTKFVNGMAYLKPKVAGLVPQTVREMDTLDVLLSGKQGSPEAKLTADEMSSVIEYGRQMFNRIAGYEAIVKRKGPWFPNPAWDRKKVTTTPTEFSQDAFDHVNRDLMLDDQTGAPMTDDRLREVLKESTNSIVTQDFDNPDFVGPLSLAPVNRGQASVTASRQKRRVIILKDAESWKFMNEKYGTGKGVLDTFQAHMQSMAHDIETMKRFGANPEEFRRHVMAALDREKIRASKSASENATLEEKQKVFKYNKKIDSEIERDKQTYNHYWDTFVTGKNDAIVDSDVAYRWQEARSFFAAAQLGGAVVSSIPDVGTSLWTGRFNGLPMTEVAMNMLRLTKDGLTGKLAPTTAQLGLSADSMIHSLHNTDKYMGETIRAGVATKAASAVISAQGLNGWSQIMRAGFATTFQAKLANAIEKHVAFNQLPFKESLERYGIDERMWSEIAQTMSNKGLFSPLEGGMKGRSLLRSVDIRDAGLDAHADAIGHMLTREMDYAAIEKDPHTKALVGGFLGGMPKGTTGGEAVRSLAMYKSFPLAMLALHGGRTMERGWDASRLGYGAGLFVTTTVLGMVSWQAANLLAGKDLADTNPMTPQGRNAWMQAIFKGGGFGIYGDIVLRDANRFGGSWTATLGGPMVGSGDDVRKWIVGNIENKLQGKETHFFGDAAWLAARYIPGSSLWYLKAAFQRSVLDQLLLYADDRAIERFKRAEKRSREDYGQEMFWPRGEILPQRMPAIGGR